MIAWGCSLRAAAWQASLCSCTAHMAVCRGCHTVPLYSCDAALYQLPDHCCSKTLQGCCAVANSNRLECMLQEHSGEAPLWSDACATVSCANFRAG